MKIFFYVIKGVENMTFDSLSEARRAYWDILDADGLDAAKLRGHKVAIVRENYRSGKTREFSVR